jgi:hypothetical protein
MMKKAVFLVLLLSVVGSTLFSQHFTPRQKAWLYRIVSKSACLKKNWDSYFVYTGGFAENKDYGKYKVSNRWQSNTSLWDSIEQSIVLNPELLQVNWEAIAETSPGLIADASVKLSLWELYSNLKQGFVDSLGFVSNQTAQYFYTQMIAVLPSGMRKGAEVKKKYRQVLYDVLNPSLNIGTKTASLNQLNKVSVQSRKEVFDRWNRLVNQYVDKQSKQYFQMLCSEEVYFQGYLLAAGEGSGSSGLLKEFEEREGEGIHTGTGKGIGLFTYRMSVKKDVLVPDFQTETQVMELAGEPTLLHLTLWGMDWSKKPLVVIEKGAKSYLLFGSENFSPDPHDTEGTSFVDKIQEFEEKKITKFFEDLNSDGGLLSIYKREENLRDKIQAQIEWNNLETDSLRKQKDVSEAAIQQRLRRNDVHLSNLSDKEKKLSAIQKKISVVYQHIDAAERELRAMEAQLGPNIQEWQKHDSLYRFADGTTFNAHTQDLVFYGRSEKIEQIKVTLLPASYSIYSQDKDEVQLYVNVTGGVNIRHRVNEKEIELPVLCDTILKKTLFFAPNAHVVTSCFSEEEKIRLGDMVAHIRSGEMELNTACWALGVDTLNHPSIARDMQNYSLKKDLARFKASRRVDMKLLKTGEKYSLEIAAYADAGNTTLSSCARSVDSALFTLKNDEQSLNPALSVLRVMGVIREIELITNLDFKGQKIRVVPINEEWVIRE